MATKKTNKTSHVMNLLTNGAPTETENQADASAQAATEASSGSQEEQAAGTQDKKGDVQSHTVTPKKVTVVDESSRNDRLSQEILNKLSEELEEEEGMENQKPDTAPQQEAEAVLEQEAPAAAAEEAEKGDTAPAAEAQAAEPVSEPSPSAPPEVPAEAPVSQAEAAEAPASQPEITEAPAPQAETAKAPAKAPETAKEAEPAPAPAPEPSAPPEEEIPIQLSGKTAHHAILPKSDIEGNLINGEYRFVNIMEHLMLRQDISSYLDQYNVCKCPRCMADVCALALTGLPAKYVVTSKDSLSPLLSYYESRNKITMLTALIKACNKVRENPRHKRS